MCSVVGWSRCRAQFAQVQCLARSGARRSVRTELDREPEIIVKSCQIPQLVFALLWFASGADAVPPTLDPVTVHVFHRSPIHFTPDDPARFDTALITASDNGREINRTVTLPRFDYEVRILARVTTRPIPQDAASVYDKWDRAANVCLLLPGQPDVEIVKFITAYGGRTTHEVDVTRLSPVLTGECTIRGFIDTWSSPGWEMDFELVFEPADTGKPPDWMEEWLDEESLGPPDWCIPVAYATVTRDRSDRGDVSAHVTIPRNTKRVVLDYLVSGHCTDGRGADEFVSKDNVILIDHIEIHRYRPWRDDCRRFRDVNPHCRRWFDGSWSADFSRSGWCPGDVVMPQPIDVTRYLSAGDHRLEFAIEEIRPQDESGYGYWRMSAVLVGWNDKDSDR